MSTDKEIFYHIRKECDPHIKEMGEFYEDLRNRMVELLSKYKLEEEITLEKDKD